MQDKTKELRADVERIKVQRDHALDRMGYLQQVITDAIEALEVTTGRDGALKILKAAVPVEH